jgi:hypothetical protein
MFDDDRELNRGLTDLYEMFPFFRSFPFDYYEFELDKSGVNSESLMLDPVIIKAGGGYVEPHLVHFKHSSSFSDLTISFYTYDVKYVYESADKIKKMDELARSLSGAIESTDLEKKLMTIKEGEKMLKKIGSGLLKVGAFDKILDQLNGLSEDKLSKTELRLIKSLSPRIKQHDFSESHIELISEYYDMHLHHINIVLGIIIASKIHP